MIFRGLKAILNAFTGVKENDPHPLDGATKRAFPTLDPEPAALNEAAAWPFPVSRPEEPPKKKRAPAKKKPAVKTTAKKSTTTTKKPTTAAKKTTSTKKTSSTKTKTKK